MGQINLKNGAATDEVMKERFASAVRYYCLECSNIVLFCM
jgi:hypothetical protein